MIVCSMPECQTSAGCMCRKSRIIFDPPRWHSQDEVNELHRRHIEAVTRLTDHIEQLERENAELREALEPFAKVADELTPSKYGPAWGFNNAIIEHEDFRRARRLIDTEAQRD